MKETTVKMTSTSNVYMRVDNHSEILKESLARLQHEKAFHDVRLASGHEEVFVNRMLLAAFSPFIEDLIKGNPNISGLIVTIGVPFVSIKLLVDYIYQGFVNVPPEQVRPLLYAAERLEIKGLWDSLKRRSASSKETLGHEVHNAKRTTDNATQSTAAGGHDQLSSADTFAGESSVNVDQEPEIILESVISPEQQLEIRLVQSPSTTQSPSQSLPSPTPPTQSSSQSLPPPTPPTLPNSPLPPPPSSLGPSTSRVMPPSTPLLGMHELKAELDSVVREPSPESSDLEVIEQCISREGTPALEVLEYVPQAMSPVPSRSGTPLPSSSLRHPSLSSSSSGAPTPSKKPRIAQPRTFAHSALELVVNKWENDSVVCNARRASRGTFSPRPEASHQESPSTPPLIRSRTPESLPQSSVALQHKACGPTAHGSQGQARVQFMPRARSSSPAPSLGSTDGLSPLPDHRTVSELRWSHFESTVNPECPQDLSQNVANLPVGNPSLLPPPRGSGSGRGRSRSRGRPRGRRRFSFRTRKMFVKRGKISSSTPVDEAVAGPSFLCEQDGSDSDKLPTVVLSQLPPPRGRGSDLGRSHSCGRNRLVLTTRKRFVKSDKISYSTPVDDEAVTGPSFLHEQDGSDSDKLPTVEPSQLPPPRGRGSDLGRSRSRGQTRGRNRLFLTPRKLFVQSDKISYSTPVDDEAVTGPSSLCEQDSSDIGKLLAVEAQQLPRPRGSGRSRKRSHIAPSDRVRETLPRRRIYVKGRTSATVPGNDEPRPTPAPAPAPAPSRPGEGGGSGIS